MELDEGMNRMNKNGFKMPLSGAFCSDRFDHQALTHKEINSIHGDNNLMNDYIKNKDNIYVEYQNNFDKKNGCLNVDDESYVDGDYVENSDDNQNNIFGVHKMRRQKRRRKIKVDNKKEFRKVISSLDVEKNRRLLRTVVIHPNEKGTWSIGLIINLAKNYNENGEKLVIKKKVKSLTILYLTSYTKKEIEKYFNTKTSVLCPNLRKYCGFLTVVCWITNIPTFELAKQMFVYWKEGTRGGRSRMMCGLRIHELFKEDYSGCENLKHHFRKTPALQTIKKLMSLNNNNISNLKINKMKE